MKVLELFAGSRCIGKSAECLGYDVFSVDWKQYGDIDLLIDIEFITKTDIPFIPDFIWCSPDCATYSIAGIRHHRKGIIPVSDYAKKCDNVNRNMLALIRYYLTVNPNLIFYIENPRGMMRKMPFMKDLERKTVWYCRYDDSRAKPTDIWTNNLFSLFNLEGWKARPECYNNNLNCHHDRSPRGSKTGGTQGKRSPFERSKIPSDLCRDILLSSFQVIKNKSTLNI